MLLLYASTLAFAICVASASASDQSGNLVNCSTASDEEIYRTDIQFSRDDLSDAVMIIYDSRGLPETIRLQCERSENEEDLAAGCAGLASARAGKDREILTNVVLIFRDETELGPALAAISNNYSRNSNWDGDSPETVVLRMNCALRD